MIPGDIDWNVFNRDEVNLTDDYDDVNFEAFDDAPSDSDRTSDGTPTSSFREDDSYEYSMRSRSFPVVKTWSEKAIEKVIGNTTDPIGKFLRDLRISPSDALQLDIMPFLDRAPRKPRVKYGRRLRMSEDDRAALCRARNREHAKATRMRRKVFEEVLQAQLCKVSDAVKLNLTSHKQALYLQRRRLRARHFFDVCSLLCSEEKKASPEEEEDEREDGDEAEESVTTGGLSPAASIHLQISRTAVMTSSAPPPPPSHPATAAATARSHSPYEARQSYGRGVEEMEPYRTALGSSSSMAYALQNITWMPLVPLVEIFTAMPTSSPGVYARDQPATSDSRISTQGSVETEGGKVTGGDSQTDDDRILRAMAMEQCGRACRRLLCLFRAELMMHLAESGRSLHACESMGWGRRGMRATASPGTRGEGRTDSVGGGGGSCRSCNSVSTSSSDNEFSHHSSRVGYEEEELICVCQDIIASSSSEISDGEFLGICMKHLQLSIIPNEDDVLVQGRTAACSIDIVVHITQSRSIAVSVPGHFLSATFDTYGDQEEKVQDINIEVNLTSLVIGLLEGLDSRFTCGQYVEAENMGLSASGGRTEKC